MSTIALGLNDNTTTSAPHALASAEVSSSDNPRDLRSLSDDHGHTLAKDNSTNQHLDQHRGADGQNFCSRCNEIMDFFDFERRIRVKSWHTLDLRVLARSDAHYKHKASGRVWIITNSNIGKGCSFCSFLMDCALRMTIYTAVDLKYDDWFVALRVNFLEYWTREATSTYNYGSDIKLLELSLCRDGDTKNPFIDTISPQKDYGLGTHWAHTHLILPVQAYDDRHSEVSDAIDWELIKEWLDTCQAKHDNVYCIDLATAPREDIPSFCLIDCETEMIIPAAEISHPNYVTLSYVWGASTTLPQVLDAITSLPVLPDSNQRPKVVNDAMEAVQRIGYRYLWVDRYCIPQSDHDAKSIQIKNMGRIYSMSVFTIIAAAGHDAEYGLPGVSSRRTLQPLWTTICRGNRAIPVIHFEPPNEDILRSTWNSRGWTYQEALLSRRRLVFTDRHVYFQCESMQSIGYYLDSRVNYHIRPIAARASEVFPFREHYNVLHVSTREGSIWARINDYTKRILSYEEDTINAVQGILDSFRNVCDVWFFYGLPVMDSSSSDFDKSQNFSTVLDFCAWPVGTVHVWKIASGMQAILSSLFWRDCWQYTTVATHSTQKMKFNDQAMLRRKAFPSWTWAGWEAAKCGVTIEGRDIAHRTDYRLYIPDGFLFEIWVSYDEQCLTWSRDNQEIRRRAENNDQCPNFLIISGPVFDVRITCTDAELQRTAGPPVWKYTSPRFLAIGTYEGPRYPINGVRGNTIDLIALCIFSKADGLQLRLHALLLRPVDEDTDGKIYERVTCTFHYFHQSQLAGLNLRQMELRIR